MGLCMWVPTSKTVDVLASSGSNNKMRWTLANPADSVQHKVSAAFVSSKPD